MLNLADIIEALSGLRPDWARQVITEAVVDPRQVIPGSLYVALPGQALDERNDVAQAFERGASVALVQKEIRDRYPVLDLRKDKTIPTQAAKEAQICIRVDDTLAALQRIAHFWRRNLSARSPGLRVIGIAGTAGKSTTTELVAEVLDQRYRTLKSHGTSNNEVDLPLTLLSLGEGHQRAVLQIALHPPGEIARDCDLALPQVGVIIDTSALLAGRVDSQSESAQDKAGLVRALPPAPEGVAILNYDDPLIREMASVTRARVFFYGLDPEANLWADNIEGLGLEGIRFRLHYRHEVLHLRVPLIGRHSVHAVLCAAAVGLTEGLTWQEIVGGLRSQHAQLRLVAVKTKAGALILDDTYNASPESTLAALNLLSEIEGRRMAVLGDMLELGQLERRGHEMVGLRAAELVHELVTVGERAHWIASSARKAGLPSRAITELVDSQQAIDYLQDRLKERDVVLIKGSRPLRMDRIVAALEADP
jgi:UDP-N-acetylmuramoyl-tripeptide--D-alanyl-D-alanine ligase